MKICFFANGGSIHTVRWCTHFQKLGHEVHLISFENVVIPTVKIHFIDIGNVNVHGGNWKVLFKYRKIKRLLKVIKPDIFHALYATSYGITGALCGFQPFIITALGTDVLISPKESLMYRILLRYAFSKARWITAMSDFMKKEIVGLNVSENKISVVPFGIDPLIFNDNNRSLPTNKFVVTSTRNFESIYNIEHLIEAIAKIRNEIPNLHLNLIGIGSLKKKFEDQILKLQLVSLVSFFGKLSQPEIAKTFDETHVFVSVSLSDGNNISLNEAMASSVLCIATNIPANTQWIKDGENGFLVEINDVNSLAQKIIDAYRTYNQLQSKFVPLNKSIILDRCIWASNMKRVEDKYKSLILA